MLKHAYQGSIKSLSIVCIIFAWQVQNLQASFGITQFDPSALTDQLFLELARAEMSDADKALSREIILDWISKCNTHVCSPSLARPIHQDGILHAAAKKGHALFLACLLKLELGVDDRNDLGKTPLFLATERGHCSAVRVLIDAGADMSMPDNDGVTPLHSAAGCGHVPIVRLLVDRGADIFARDNEGRTPLFSAAHFGSASIVRLLLLQDLRLVDALAHNLETPLHAAAAQANKEVVCVLIQRGGALLDPQDNHGMTPLMRATEACADLDRQLMAAEEAPHESLRHRSGYFASEYHETRKGHCSAVRDTVKYLFTISDLAAESRAGTSAEAYVRECSERFFDPNTWGERFFKSFKTAKLCLNKDEFSLPVVIQKLIMFFAWCQAHHDCYESMEQRLCLNEEGAAHDE